MRGQGYDDSSPANHVSSRTVLGTLTILTCFKVLCIPSYRSTDFDVHRNWLAITRHLPLEDWYFDDVNGTTVHTLDYPPGFAFFEYFLSRNFVTEALIQQKILDERCLALLGDQDNRPSPACVAFHRSTVIWSDLFFWTGAYIASNDWTGFLFLVCNPGLLWLDHVHFQYNGMLLGILLGSLGLLARGSTKPRNQLDYHVYHLIAAFLFALLLTMKHLYLPLAPLYFVYLLSNYCIGPDNKFSVPNFLQLALVTGSTLVAPFLPFVVLTHRYSPSEQLAQMLARLFPFGRGLVHDYWAANVWAIWTLGDKMLNYLPSSLPLHGLPEVPPSLCSVCLLIGLVPGLVCAWKASSTTLLHCVVYCSLTGFMLAYHVHEKAIMTAIIPLTIMWSASNESAQIRRLFARMTTLGLLGLFPLLFRPIELGLKVTSYVAYVSICWYWSDGTWMDITGFWCLAATCLFLEVVHPLLLYPVMEFLPLLLTSTMCAVGLLLCWLETGLLMWTASRACQAAKVKVG